MNTRRTSPALLSVDGLSVEFQGAKGSNAVRAVQDVSFEIGHGEAVGIVGESGSGKSVTVMSVLGLVPSPPARIAASRVQFDGQDLLHASERKMRAVRGGEIGMVFQDPTGSLNPVYSVGYQIVEALRLHSEIDWKPAWKQAINLLEMVGIPEPHRRVKEHPHQFSGGMRQRVMIAIAIANNPKLLIADEPTTALDVTVEAQIMDLFQQLRKETGTALVLISHDLGLVAERVDRVIVMYGGRAVETAPASQLYENPFHPYSRGLLRAIPRLDSETEKLHTIPGSPPSGENIPSGCPFHPRCDLMHGRERCQTEAPAARELAADRVVACHFAEEAFSPSGAPWSGVGESEPTGRQDLVQISHYAQTVAAPAGTTVPVLEVEALTKSFSVRSVHAERGRQQLVAVDNVSFEIQRGETLGFVGESGCGKTTTGRCIVRLLKPDSGKLTLNGRRFDDMSLEAFRPFRREIQYMFQDPFTSLNPRMTVTQLLREPLDVHDLEDKDSRIDSILEDVGMLPSHRNRYPHEFSGGQAQRIALARALIVHPSLLVLDEPISALDVSIQAQIVNLLQELQERLNLAYLFIAHDLGVVRHLSDRVGVMYLGRLVESGPAKEVFASPRHPYTVSLLRSSPSARVAHGDLSSSVLRGEVPSPISPPPGCHFHPRCWKAEYPCMGEIPELRGQPDNDAATRHRVACFYPESVATERFER